MQKTSIANFHVSYHDLEDRSKKDSKDRSFLFSFFFPSPLDTTIKSNPIVIRLSRDTVIRKWHRLAAVQVRANRPLSSQYQSGHRLYRRH